MNNERIRRKIADILARHVGGEARLYMDEAEDFVDELKTEGLAVIQREPDEKELLELLHKSVGYPVGADVVRKVIESLEVDNDAT